MRGDTETLLAAAKELPPEQLPAFLGELETVRCTAMARLAAPAPVQVSGPEELLNVKAAARRLNVNVGHLYRHSRNYPFTVRIGSRLRFSALGMDDWIRGRNDSASAKPRGPSLVSNRKPTAEHKRSKPRSR
jgi:hypothetical protein